jgi:MSHA biogenesis protein MshL
MSMGTINTVAVGSSLAFHRNCSALTCALTCALMALMVLLLASCQSQQPPPRLNPQIAAEIAQAAAQSGKLAAPSAQMQDALMPPLRAPVPGGPSAASDEQRFDLSVNDTPARQMFFAIVSGTRYNMLVHPELAGNVTVRLKDVNVPEVMEAMRDMYGYEYRIDGNRIFVQPPSLQTRVFRVNYLVAQRLGRSDIRVTSSSISDNPGGGGGAVAQPLAGTTGAAPASITGSGTESSRIQTAVRNDFWEDLRSTLIQMVGTQNGRSVVANPQAGLLVVRALPSEQRQVAQYLREIRLSVERQVVLEAKIIEVTLNDQYQAGVNWALFAGSRAAGGVINPSNTLGVTGAQTNGSLTINSASGAASMVASSAAGSLISGASGALLGLAFQTQNFTALLNFLDSQGSSQVLSSPRIATLNNQKAVLKVGTDQFFITNIAGGSTTTGGLTGGTTSFPSLTLRPFFSGVSLDITPQIDEDSSIILHIHPSVSVVAQDNRSVNLGTTFGGAVTLPLASSTVSETDSVVRVRDGNIVAIGGLMKLDLEDNRSGLPGAKDAPGVGALFRSNSRTAVKKELVILIKPTVIQSDADWGSDVRDTRDRLQGLIPGGPIDAGGPAR